MAHVLAPGFTHAQQALTADLMRLVLLSTLIFAASGVVVGTLHAHQHFLLPAIAPCLYNLGIIAGALFLAPGMGVYGLAWGVIGGAVMQLPESLIGTAIAIAAFPTLSAMLGTRIWARPSSAAPNAALADLYSRRSSATYHSRHWVSVT